MGCIELVQFGKEFLIGACHIDVSRCIITCGQNSHALQPKFMELLCSLAQHYPEPVSRDELIAHIWQGNAYVGKKALTNAIWHLRSAFKQCDAQHEYIETLRKTGYRLCISPQAQEPKQAQTKPLKRSFALIFLGIMALSAIIFLWWPQPATKIAQASSTKITDELGRELFPSVSPDGQWLLYSWRRLGQPTNLYKQSLLAPEQSAQAITQSPYRESRGVFSADMHSLFYYRKGKDIGCQVVQHSLLNNKVQILDECLSKGSADVAISKDGHTLAYIGLSADGTTNIAYLRDLRTGSKRPLSCTHEPCQFRDEALALSPDASHLVVSRNYDSGHEELVLINATSGEQQQLTSGFLDVRGVAWHPLLSRLTFSVIEQGRRQGYHLHLPSGQLQALDLPGFSYPHYGPDGALYYHRWRIPKSIVRLSLDADVASTPFPLLLGEHSVRYPAYSEQAKKIVFVSNESGFDELWSADVDGSNRRQLTHLQMTAEDPSWSHDGRYIAFNAFSEHSNHLYIYDMHSGRAQQLEVSLNYFGRPTWSLDNHHLYVSDQKQLYSIDLNTLSVQALTQDGGAYAMAMDEQTLIYAKPQGKRLYLLNLSDGTSAPLTKEVLLSGAYGWHYHNEKVYFFKVNRADYRISRYDMATNKVTDVIRVQERGFSRNLGMSFVPHKNWLLYSAYKDPQIDIMVYR